MNVTENENEVRAFIANGTHLSAMDNQGRTALMYAAQEGDNFAFHNCKCVEFINYTFWEYQAQLRSPNITGRESMVKLLIENGADVNAVNTHNHSALFLACKSGKFYGKWHNKVWKFTLSGLDVKMVFDQTVGIFTILVKSMVANRYAHTLQNEMKFSNELTKYNSPAY